MDAGNVPSMRVAMKKVLRVGVLAAICAGLIYLGNVMYVGQPVAAALAEDGRNHGVDLSARVGFWIQPSILILDLRDIEPTKTPVDLWRAMFQAAEALDERGRSFERVVLARRGSAVFALSGQDFSSLGFEYGAGQNPVYLLRTLPEKLYHPDGSPAFGTWSGGLLGVTTRQMEDLSDAFSAWAFGS